MERKTLFAAVPIIILLTIFFATTVNQNVVRADSSYNPWDHDSNPKTPDADTNGWTISGETVLDKDMYFDGDGITIDGDDFTLDLNGYSIIGTGTGIGVKLVGRADVIVDGGTVRNFETGIYLENSHDNFVTYMLIEENTFGIYLFDFSEWNRIDFNVIRENNDGIFAIYHCNLNFIRGNLIQENSNDGIQLIGCNENKIGGNRIEDNQRHGIKLFGWIDGELFEHPCDNNFVTSNVLSNNEHGLYIMDESEYNQIQSNSISKNEFGVYFDASAGNPDNNVISGNSICKNGVGVRIKMVEDPPQTNVLVFNSIFDNREWDVMAGSHTKANFNWWGDEEGPAVGEDVSEVYVHFEPWLLRETLGE